jgi:predicted nuclease of predicted toxin-antitoxin system
MIIADENIEDDIILSLRKIGFEIISVKESHRGISDIEVINLAKKHNALLITEDKDFGELVFAHGIERVKVILLRYKKIDYHNLFENLLKAIEMINQRTNITFATITCNKIRYSKI